MTRFVILAKENNFDIMYMYSTLQTECQEEMNELAKKSEDKPCPYATTVGNYVALISKVIKGYSGFTYVYALRRNIAYSLQYLEFLIACIRHLKMSEVTRALTYKAFILYGCSIIEGLLHYLLIEKGIRPITEWKELLVEKGDPKTLNNKVVRIDTHVLEKLPVPESKEISFDKMLDIAEKKKLLGHDINLYPRLNFLRKLRNKIHLYLIENNRDTDYNRFNENDIKAMAHAVYSIFTSGIFRPSEREKKYFDYLRSYLPENP